MFGCSVCFHGSVCLCYFQLVIKYHIHNMDSSPTIEKIIRVSGRFVGNECNDVVTVRRIVLMFMFGRVRAAML